MDDEIFREDDLDRESDIFPIGFNEFFEEMVRKRKLRARLNLQVVHKTGWGYLCGRRMRVGVRQGVVVTIVRCQAEVLDIVMCTYTQPSCLNAFRVWENIII